ncbi:TetR family transcriptional regulator [Nakamurella sp. YIM 132087]|uniref:TetR family transcriptional regulator n=1 Tax=Nakamurella alba TaxID=2665158 RepID=A0A7K1FLR1_9ACTN|nr:TetR family transcriptional regulator [Nakamurella alba]MTD15046.1 TetR family transcriptional regulator [Nakamurella alba]
MTTSGLRERKKADTRRALTEAAVGLCIERGYQVVTVADIAEAAGVSRRTFSNYFPGKAECVVGFGDGLLSDVLDVVAAAPPGTAMRDLLVLGLARLTESFGTGFDGFVELVQSEPDLQAAEVAVDAAIIERITEAVVALVDARPGDIRPRAFAVTACALARVAGDSWVLDGRPGGTDGLSQRLTQAFSLLDPDALTR